MNISIRVTRVGWPIGDMTKRTFNNLKKEAFKRTAIYWHLNFRPKHFTHEGAREYEYEKRKGERMAKGSKNYRQSYTGRKEAQKGHTLPLVWSGDSERASRSVRIYPTFKGVRIAINAPKLNYRPKKGRIDMRDEMTRVSRSEWETLGQVFDEELQKLIDWDRSVNVHVTGGF